MSRSSGDGPCSGPNGKRVRPQRKGKPKYRKTAAHSGHRRAWRAHVLTYRDRRGCMASMEGLTWPLLSSINGTRRNRMENPGSVILATRASSPNRLWPDSTAAINVLFPVHFTSEFRVVLLPVCDPAHALRRWVGLRGIARGAASAAVAQASPPALDRCGDEDGGADRGDTALRKDIPTRRDLRWAEAHPTNACTNVDYDSRRNATAS